MKKKLCLIGLISVLLSAGCGSRNKTVPDLPPAPAEERDYDFIFVCPIIDNEYWQSCIQGIWDADEELGTTTHVTGPREAADFDREIIRYMGEALESEPDGIMGYAGIRAMFPLINQAGEKGIPFLAVDSDAPSTTRIAYIGTNLYAFGYKAGESMVRLTDGMAKIGYICSSFSAQNEAEVLRAFEDAISDYNMDIIAVGEGWSDPERAAGAVEAMLAECPEITAIFCTGGYNVTGAARVKKIQGLNSLILVGFDDVEENLAFVREGVIDALLVQLPYQMGYQGVHLLKEFVDKGKVERDAYDTGSILINQENVDSYWE